MANRFSKKGLSYDEETGEYDYNSNTLDGSVNFTPHYGDEAPSLINTPNPILEKLKPNPMMNLLLRGGEGIEPFNIEFEILA